MPFYPTLRSRYTYLAILLVAFSVPVAYRSIPKFQNSIRSMGRSHLSSQSRPPVYFLGIGGPGFMENKAHAGYTKLQEVGLEITTKVKPKAIVVFSAHWQEGPSKVLVNAAEHTDQIYDFYGFPPHYYEKVYPYKGSPELAGKVVEKLEGAGIEIEKVRRGLDHGVWAGFIVAFDPKKNPLNVPIVQVSLFGSEDSDQHYRMGQALESLRDEGVVIMGAGMAVHNLNEFLATRETGSTKPYVYSFDEALKEAVTAKPEDRRAKMLELMKRGDVRKAHPTLEHILPIHVAAGAAGSSIGEQIWTLQEGTLSWAQYRFVDAATA
ncbi:hypothetical protein G7046_g1328 [Stylonectria norvegica]|nr:hypothetical protein G7046_g1328 [Stylonectria norvegica]